jgi:hypothetical protein
MDWVPLGAARACWRLWSRARELGSGVWRSRREWSRFRVERGVSSRVCSGFPALTRGARSMCAGEAPCRWSRQRRVHGREGAVSAPMRWGGVLDLWAAPTELHPVRMQVVRGRRAWGERGLAGEVGGSRRGYTSIMGFLALRPRSLPVLIHFYAKISYIY